MPVYLIKINIFGLPTNVLEVLILIVLAWTILKQNFRESFAGWLVGLKPNFKIAISIILIGLAVSTLVNENYAVGAGIIKGWFVLPFLFALVAKNTTPKEKTENIYKALYFSGLAVAILSLAYYFFGIMTFDGRLQGIFNSPNYLAMYLAPAILIGVVSSKYNVASKKEKIFLIFSLGIIAVSFYLTYSYAAWGAVLVSLIIIEFIKNKITIKKILILALVVIVIGFSQWNTQKFTDLKNTSERSSFSSRIIVWKSAGKIIKDNWMLGIGPGNFQNKYLEYQKYFPPYLEWAVPHPHNLFLSFWLQSGLIGLISFAYLLFLWLKNIFTKKERDMIWYISLGIMLYFVLHGLADTTYFKNDLAVVFWINFLAIL